MLFEKIKEYRKLKTPIQMDGFMVIGYFPYEVASIRNQLAEIPCPPRALFSEFEAKLAENNISDNKCVYICKDTTNFGTTNFAIQLKDMYARIGSWEDVTSYAGRKFTIIE